MFDIGSTELLFLIAFPFSGIAAAVYLAVALHNNARRGEQRR